MTVPREPNAEPIPGYRLIEPLGSGGFGEAWKCQAPGGIFKAIKFVFGNLYSADTEGARAEQELRALNRIKEVRHPFILQLDRIEDVRGELVIVMELADKSLHDAFEEARASGLVGIPRDTLLRYIRDAAEALDHMNEKHQLQHLDIKPRNLFLVSDRVKVADFGLVKTLERSGASGAMGAVTPLYSPPETLTGEISPHSDQYSLAIVYQELLTGHRPFNGKNARQLAHQHLHEPPDLRALPEGERPVVARALEKDPARRFPNCLAFVRALYAARNPTLLSIGGGDPGSGHDRPKTMLDTLESFQLEGAPDGAPPDSPALVRLGAENEAVSNVGMTIARPDTGPLRPTLVVGLGAFGRRALLELRCRLLDRFGDLDKAPMFRFLYVDTDADAVKASQRGAAEVALRPHEAYHLPLQPVSHYRRRQLDQLVEWLPREKLYAIPRSLKAQGCRALGRLAFTDNYVRLLARLKREVQEASNPDRIVHTVNQTGLALRDDVPRVYVLAAATGGSSGCLVDLGYTLRRLLKQIGHSSAPLTAFVSCGAPDDPATPRAEQANVYATLTELNHFADPAISFSAQYGVDGPRLVDEGPAFDQVYLLAQSHRGPEERRDELAHLGSYLFHELTTPLGIRLDHARKRKAPTLFRSMGTFGVWFPRGLLLRLAARDSCLRLLDEWQQPGSLAAQEQAILDAALHRIQADPELTPDALANAIAARAGEQLDAHPRDALTRVLLGVEEQSIQPIAQDDPGNWARQALLKVRDWLGTGVSVPGINAISQKRSALTRALESAAAALAREWDERLGEVIAGLTEQGGRRIALAEAAAARLIHLCDEAMNAQKARVQKQSARTAAGKETLEESLQSCATGGGWSLFGSRSRRSLRIFVDHLAGYARQCLAEDLTTVVLQFHAALRGKLADRLRDLGFCRQRLRHLQDLLRECDDGGEPEELSSDSMTFTRAQATGSWQAQGHTPALLSAESYWQSIRESRTNRVVLPEGETDLERAARSFLSELTPDHWQQLDQAIGDQVLSPRGGLIKLCLDAGDIVRQFAGPLLSQAISLLTGHLPVTDVAEVELSSGDSLDRRVTEYFESAQPPLALSSPGILEAVGSGLSRASLAALGRTDVRPGLGKTRGNGVGYPSSFLLVPASQAGRSFGEAAHDLLPELSLVNVPGQADLMFCRELGGLRLEELEPLLRNCRASYQEAVVTPPSSPHSRFDMTDWAPLDP
jgi:hypothetical protein